MSPSIVATLVAPLSPVLGFFRALADDKRLAILRLLALSDLRAGEISAALGLPSNAVSYHLKQLTTLGLLLDHRSSGDGRDVYYRLDLEHLDRLYMQAGDALHPGLTPLVQSGVEALGTATTPLRVLFLCTHNSARSQLAEAILRHMGGDNVEVFSAGSVPTEVHTNTLVVLHELEIDTSPLCAKSMDQFESESFDYIITVCDRVRDICPVFRGDPLQIHWSFPDPVVAEAPEQLAAFRRTAVELQTRVRYLLLLTHPRTGERMHPLGANEPRHRHSRSYPVHVPR
jgi:ArsR family transcriptional regulator, arsenate/arsenite/antimonite-responsive transcriptional repressor / arsenate reductase (thioredoxin)